MSIELLFVEPLGYDHAGLRVVKVGAKEYAVADDDDAADRAALECAEESLWAFRSEFLGSFLDISPCSIKAIAKMQGDMCEDAQEIIVLLLGDRLQEFLSDAIDIDGRGHFLSPYDGEENDGGDVSPALVGRLVYRLN